MSQIKVLRDQKGTVEVWLDCDQENYTGLCLGSSRTHPEAAILQALEDLTHQIEILRTLMMREIVANALPAAPYTDPEAA